MAGREAAGPRQASAVKRSVLKTGRGPDWAMAGQHRSVKIRLAASDQTSGEKRDGHIQGA